MPLRIKAVSFRGKPRRRARHTEEEHVYSCRQPQEARAQKLSGPLRRKGRRQVGLWPARPRSGEDQAPSCRSQVRAPPPTGPSQGGGKAGSFPLRCGPEASGTAGAQCAAHSSLGGGAALSRRELRLPSVPQPTAGPAARGLAEGVRAARALAVSWPPGDPPTPPPLQVGLLFRARNLSKEGKLEVKAREGQGSQSYRCPPECIHTE